MTNRLSLNGTSYATNGHTSAATGTGTSFHALRRSGSPFLDAESFESKGDVPIASPTTLRSPFLQRFVDEEGEDAAPTVADARRLLMGELHDDELDGALYELAGEGARSIRNIDDPRTASATLQLTYAPMLREVDAALQRVSDRLGDRDPAAITESELEDAFADRAGAALSPAMENFFGGIGRALGRIASGAANLAKKGIAAVASLGLKPIIAMIRRLLPKAIGELVKRVIHRIPAALQPDARRLAQALHVPVANELVADESPELAFDVASVQDEFNAQVADYLLGEDAAESEYERYVTSPGAIDGVGVHDLDRARERFVGELAAMQDGEDPRPAVERFVPALMPALMLAKRIIPRDKVVRLITPLVAQLISRFVGPQSSSALSRAMVDAGLKLVGFELPEDGGRVIAHEAIANTVEETVRRVAALPDEVLDDHEMVEGAILHEFERAAAANFPPLLPRPIYRQRPDLLEADRTRGVWVPCRAGNRRRRFKKYSRVFRTRITPRMAMVIPTFAGGTLAGFLDEQLGAEPGETLEADVHLYEAMPGMLLSEVGEEEGEGGGFTTEYDVHPLTSEAASMLLGEPGLGQELPRVLTPARAMSVGQRFYRLSIPGRSTTAGIGGAVRPHRKRRRSHLHVTMDVPNGSAILSLYLGERRAQEIATALRTRPTAGAPLARLRPMVERMLRAALSGEATGRVRILHPRIDAAAARGSALRQLSAAHLQQFTTHLLHAALGGVSTFLKGQSARFIAATEDTRDGVTLRIAVTNPRGMTYIARTLGGGTSGVATTVPGVVSPPNAGAPAPVAPTAGAAAPVVTVDVTAGHRHG